MKNNILIRFLSSFAIILFIGLALFSCKKDKEEEKPVSHLDSFVSLKAERDTMFSSQSTQIRAVVVGSNLKFKWSTTAGNILGANDVVTYAAASCVIGTNEITCTVSGDNKSETKTIIITVF